MARKQFVAWQAGKLNTSYYADSVVPKLTDEKIDRDSRALGTLGALTSTTYIGPLAAPDIRPDERGYIYQMHCVGGAVYLVMIVDAQGKIANIFFRDRLQTETVEGTPAPAAPSPSPPR